jgi:hypothetical protein
MKYSLKAEAILCCSRAERKFLKICSLYNVENGLYRVFTTAKRALSFQQKRAFIQEILFSFFKWDTLAQKKGHFFTFKKVGGGMAPMPHSSSVTSRYCGLKFLLAAILWAEWINKSGNVL